MVEPHLVRFWHAALQSGLITEPELRELWDQLPPEKRTPDAADRRLARKVLEAGKMTRWQAQQLLAGVKPQALRYDKYVLTDLIGQGGMGRVYQARDTRLNRFVAIKVLSRERMNNTRAIARFQREAKVGAQLQHENLVRIYDEGEVNGSLYIVMEFIQGKNVGSLLGSIGPIPFPTACRLGREVALGLEHASHKGLVHRDVNPMNILINRAGQAKLTDLGLAIELGEQGDAVTRDGATVGTFDYISPEQARHSRSIDIRSDIYSLGCTLYHMLSGRVPFPQPSLPEKLYNHQMTEPDRLDDIVPAMPAGLDAVVRRMMAKQPENRFATPQEVAEALAPYAGPVLTLAQIEQVPEQPIWIDGAIDSDFAPGQGATLGSAASTGVTPGTTPRSEGSQPAVAALAPAEASSTPTPSPSPSPEAHPFSFATESEFLSLSDTKEPRVGSRARPPGEPWLTRERLPWLIGAGGAVVVILTLLLFRGSGGSAAGPEETRAGKGGVARVPTGTGPATNGTARPKPSPPPAAAPRGILVRWLDDQSVVQAESLQDAIRQVAGKSAEVLIDQDQPLELPAELTLQVGGGPVRVRGPRERPARIRVARSSEAPLFLVMPDSSLELSDLRIEMTDVQGAKTDGPAVRLLEPHGNLTVTRCELATRQASPRARWAVIDSRRARFEDCILRGVPSPIEVVSQDGDSLVLQNCLVLAMNPADATSGTAITLAASKLGRRRGNTPRRVELTHCFVLARGLFTVNGIQRASGLEVAVTDTAIQAQALLDWEGFHPMPEGLSWKGARNWLDLGGGPSWAADHSSGTPNPARPADLAGWTGLGFQEQGTQVGPVPFRNASTQPVSERSAADFELDGKAREHPGIDPRALLASSGGTGK